MSNNKDGATAPATAPQEGDAPSEPIPQATPVDDTDQLAEQLEGVSVAAPSDQYQPMGMGMQPIPYHIKPGQAIPQFVPMGMPAPMMGPGMQMPGMQMQPGMQQVMPNMPVQGMYFGPDGRPIGPKGGQMGYAPWIGPPGGQGAPYRNRSRDGHGSNKRKDTGSLSKTNVYISGLQPNTTDEMLRSMCQSHGAIVSAKAIVDRDTSQCKGYGFVMFEKEASASAAVQALTQQGIQAAFAKVTKAQVEWQGRQEADPTNLYLTNLPKDQDENALSAMLLQCLESVKGEIVSCRVLRDAQGISRGVGLARMDCREACDAVINRLNGAILPGCVDPLRVKYANSPSPRKYKYLNRNGTRPVGGMALGDPALGDTYAQQMGMGMPLDIQGMPMDPLMLANQRTQAMMMAQVQPGQPFPPWVKRESSGANGGQADGDKSTPAALAQKESNKLAKARFQSGEKQNANPASATPHQQYMQYQYLQNAGEDLQ